MATKTEERRAALRDRLVAAAKARIEDGGLAALKARDLAADAGCAVGAIYGVVKDLEHLTLLVNLETFKEFGAHLSMAVGAVPEDQPVERLVAMARAYLDYAEAHPHRWRVLFDSKMPDDGSAPDWYQAAVDRLLSVASAALVTLPEDQRPMYARAMFGAVHGMILLSLDRRLSAVPRDRLWHELERLVRAACQP